MIFGLNNLTDGIYLWIIRLHDCLTYYYNLLILKRKIKS